MQTSTTPYIAGREIAETLGVVTGEAIIGANIFRDLLAGITDIVGGRSRAYESALKDARARTTQKGRTEWPRHTGQPRPGGTGFAVTTNPTPRTCGPDRRFG